MRQVYDEVSPITGNRCVLIEEDGEKMDYLKLCMESGYHTYQLKWLADSDVIELVEKSLPPNIIDSKHVDENNNVWYKMMLITPFLVLMPEGDDEWTLYTLKDGNPDEDEIVMAIAGEGDNVIYRALDKETRQVFPKNKFNLAMDAFQSVGAAINGIIDDTKEEFVND